MSWLDDEGHIPEAFERALLDAARHDAPARDASQAWTQFASTLSEVAAGAEPGSGLHATARDRAGTKVSSAQSGHALRPVQRYRLIAQWLLLGAVAGSALTAAWFVERRSTRVDTAEQATQSATPAVGGQRADRIQPVAPAPAPKPPPVLPTVRAGSLHRAASNVHGTAASALAAEVAQLDAARRAGQAGDFARAIALVDQYHRDFPRGALAPDAEVLAIEALAEEHDPEVVHRAARFLARYPADPHAARVRTLLAAVE